MWSQKHHTVAPLMSYKMLNHNFEIVVDMATKLWNVIGTIYSYPKTNSNLETDISNDRILNMMPYIYRLTIDVIGTIAFGHDLETIEHPEKDFTDKVKKNTHNSHF